MEAYVKNNVKVSQPWVDTVTESIPATKNLVVKNFNYKTDEFTKPESEADEIFLGNSTGSSLSECERIRYGRTKITNLSQSIGIPFDKGPTNTGIKIMAESIHLYDADVVGNDGKPTGIHYQLPTKACTTFVMPQNVAVTDDLLLAVVREHLGVLFGTNESGAEMLSLMMKGKLNPTL